MIIFKIILLLFAGYSFIFKKNYIQNLLGFVIFLFLMAWCWYDNGHNLMPGLLILSMLFWLPIITMLYRSTLEIQTKKKNNFEIIFRINVLIASLLFSITAGLIIFKSRDVYDTKVGQSIDTLLFQSINEKIIILFVLMLLLIVGAALVFGIMAGREEPLDE